MCASYEEGGVCWLLGKFRLMEYLGWLLNHCTRVPLSAGPVWVPSLVCTYKHLNTLSASAGTPLHRLSQAQGILPFLLRMLQTSLSVLADSRKGRGVTGRQSQGPAPGCGELLTESLPSCSDPR